MQTPGPSGEVSCFPAEVKGPEADQGGLEKAHPFSLRDECSNPSPSSRESVANSIWAKTALPMRLPPRLLGVLLPSRPLSAGSPIRRWSLDRGSSATHQRSCGFDPRIVVMAAEPPALPGTAQNKRLKESHELTRLLLGKADSHNNEDLARRVRRAR